MKKLYLKSEVSLHHSGSWLDKIQDPVYWLLLFGGFLGKGARLSLPVKRAGNSQLPAQPR